MSPAQVAKGINPLRNPADKRLPSFRKEMETYVESTESVYDWVERYGQRDSADAPTDEARVDSPSSPGPPPT